MGQSFGGGFCTALSFEKAGAQHSQSSIAARGGAMMKQYVMSVRRHTSLVIGRAKFNVFAVRGGELIEGRPELARLRGFAGETADFEIF
jgi:hypothetical protein